LINSYQLNNKDNNLIKGHLMPIKKPATPLTYGRVLLVGDAAGLIDPLTGEGIFYGVKSSLLAANSIARFLKKETPNLDDYNEAVNQEIMPELNVARTIQKLNTLAPRLFFHYFQENDRFWRAFCHLLRGERTYRSLKDSLNLPLKLIFSCFE
jgi:flavin-dependent dehydrogenase